MMSRCVYMYSRGARAAGHHINIYIYICDEEESQEDEDEEEEEQSGGEDSPVKKGRRKNVREDEGVQGGYD